MEVLVAGTGSIGKRHCQNVLALGHEVWAYSYRAQQGLTIAGLPEGVHPCNSLAEDSLRRFDAIVIANKTSQHIALAQAAAALGTPFFIEKPLGQSLAGVGALMKEVERKNIVVEAGFMLRFHPALKWLIAQLQSGLVGDIAYIRAVVGQWLPDWRPDSDHRAGYGANRAEGGGVLLDLIHELDLILWAGGPVSEVSAFTRDWGPLEIETEAVAQVGLRLASGALAQVTMDYVRPNYYRSLEIVGSQGVCVWDDCAGTISLASRGKPAEIVYRTDSAFIRNDMFKSHMHYFLKRIDNPQLAPASAIDDSIQALRLALASHFSAENNKHVSPDAINASFTPRS